VKWHDEAMATAFDTASFRREIALHPQHPTDASEIITHAQRIADELILGAVKERPNPVQSLVHLSVRDAG